MPPAKQSAFERTHPAFGPTSVLQAGKILPDPLDTGQMIDGSVVQSRKRALQGAPERVVEHPAATAQRERRDAQRDRSYRDAAASGRFFRESPRRRLRVERSKNGPFTGYRGRSVESFSRARCNADNSASGAIGFISSSLAPALRIRRSKCGNVAAAIRRTGLE